MIFNVLNPSLNIFQNYFLEASAGTGKTFAIEHLIVRLLIEGDSPFTIDQILAVTFTRLAAREMKNRIRTNLEQYLEKEGPKISAALICFDEAQIFTIHGFCHQMLTEFAFEAEVGFETDHPDSQDYQKLLRQTIKDYFALGLSGKDPDEVEKLLKSHRYKWDNLIQTVAKKVQSDEQEPSVLGQIVTECRGLFTKASQKREIDTPDGILKKMAQAIKKPAFMHKIQQKYKAVIVDEFQDTDPIQFSIFKELFLDARAGCFVYLVGDPKQSIYGFRNADLYTYLRAAQLFKTTAYLDTNFRSTPRLVDALNLLFSWAHGWNFLPKSKQLLSYCNVKAGKPDAPDIDDEKGSVHFLLGKASLGRARTWPTKDFEEKILFPRLVGEISALKTPLSEMVILVKDRFQATRLQTFLGLYGIPASIKRSLTETSAFQAMKDLLALLQSPRSLKALKTVLLGPLVRLTKDENLADAQKKMAALQEVYDQKGFAVFVKQFMDAYQISNPEFRQLAELIMEEGWEKLEQLNTDEEPRLQVREEEENKIPLMTVFASKGLEFEIVFALALASRHVSEAEDFEERDAEKMRQLYVALTRAKKRVYIPLLFDESRKKVAQGSASPIELFAVRWEKLVEGTDLYQKLPLRAEESVIFLEKFGENASLTYEWMKETAAAPLRQNKEEPAAPALHLQATFSFKENYLVSFTSLAQKKQKEFTPMILPEEKTIHSLPQGAETGILLHALFEEIFEKNFLSVQQIISKKLSNTPLQEWESIISKQIHELLKLPLDGFCLQDLKAADYMAEMEFLFPEERRTIKGFADLVFFKNGKYYILDWKSNWLGATDQDYHEENLKKSMQENDYYLQARIYTTALERYVKLFDNRPFQEVFGGAFYIFVRGKTFLHLERV